MAAYNITGGGKTRRFTKDEQGRFFETGADYVIPTGAQAITDPYTLYELGIDTPKLPDYLKSIGTQVPTNIPQQVEAGLGTHTPFAGEGSNPQQAAPFYYGAPLQQAQPQIQQPATGLGSAQYTQQLLASTPGQSVTGQAPSAPKAPTFTRNLEPGMTGPDVQQLQNFLVSQGFMTPDQVKTGPGIYGPQTKAAVAAWQARNGVETGGYAGFFGPKSQAFLAQNQGAQPPEKESLSGEIVKDDPLADVGIKDLTSENPESIIQKISNAFGLDTYTKQLNDLDKEKADKVAEVNENPWLSESLRTRKVSAIEEKFQSRKDALVDVVRLQNDAVGKALDVYFKEKSFQQDTLFKQMDMKSRELDRAQQQANIEADDLLARQKFAEDVRQFGLGYALQKQKLTESGTGIPGSNQGSEKIAEFQDKINQIDYLINSPGLSGSVGPSYLGRLSPFNLETFTGDQADFAAGIKQLQNKETLDLLIRIKGQGATLGALSDKEREMLERGATKFGTWEIKDKDGNGTGKYKIDEKRFVEELNTLKSLVMRSKNALVGEQQSSDMDEIDKLYQQSSGSTPTKFNPAKFYN